MNAWPEFMNWVWDPLADDDESSAMGFNEPTHWEPGDEEED